MIGGSQRSSHVLLTKLGSRGHAVALAAGLMGRGFIGWRARLDLKLRRRGFSKDHSLGYPVYRSWDPLGSIPAVVEDFRPEVAVVLAHNTGPIARGLKEIGIPIVISLQDAEFEGATEQFRELAGSAAVANSSFTASAYEQFGIRARVIHPPIERHRYETGLRGNKILFVNPVEKKGLSVALEVARLLPELDFSFLLTWPLSDVELVALKHRMNALSNARLLGARRDMRSIYRSTRLLLAPSQWEEGYGRVATEAQIAGIPVLASNRGGLPEAVGRGGVILSHDAPGSRWAEALASMLEPAKYEELSRLAKQHAARPELDIERQTSLWEDIIQGAMNSPSIP